MLPLLFIYFFIYRRTCLSRVAVVRYVFGKQIVRRRNDRSHLSPCMGKSTLFILRCNMAQWKPLRSQVAAGGKATEDLRQKKCCCCCCCCCCGPCRLPRHFCDRFSINRFRWQGGWVGRSKVRWWQKALLTLRTTIEAVVLGGRGGLKSSSSNAWRKRDRWGHTTKNQNVFCYLTAQDILTDPLTFRRHELKQLPRTMVVRYYSTW